MSAALLSTEYQSDPCFSEGVEDPLIRNIRYLDKPIDELVKSSALTKILRETTPPLQTQRTIRVVGEDAVDAKGEK